MALREYEWRGSTWQIADEDLVRYPGAVPVWKPEEKEKKRSPVNNKSRRAPKNK